MTSGAHITRAHLDSLPIDDPASAFGQIPGVFLRGGDVGLLPSASLSIRGGLANSAATYVDGAPVRSFITGTPFFTPALNGISGLDVTTGLAGVELSDIQDGVVEYHTPAGSDRFQTHWTAHTDNPFGSVTSVGYNRFAGDVSGPLGMPGLTFFASGMLQGQSSEYLGFGAQNVPVYEVGGLDTTVQVNTGSGVMSVAIPKYVSFDQGISRPFDWRTQVQLQGKVQWAYREGSSIAISAFAGGLQERNTPGTDLGDPSLFSGAHEWTRLAVVNWHHRINDAWSFEAAMSLGSDYRLSGALDPTSEIATRDPSLGIELSSLNFSSFGPLGVPLDEQIIKNIRTNSGLTVPLLNQTQFRNAQPYRLNPYAMQAGGFYTTGVDAPLALSSEQRRTGRWELHWKVPDQRQYVTVGVDADGADLASYSTGSTISELGLDAWMASPSRTGIFFQDVISFGSVTVEAGLRYDHLNPGVVLPISPGFTFSNPNWDPTINSTSPDAQYQAAVSKVFYSTGAQSAVTPRVRLGWEVDSVTSLHAAFGQTLTTPPVSAVAANSNSDLAFTSLSSSVFGRNVTDGVASSVEAGVQRRFGAATSADITGYYDFHIPVYGAGSAGGVRVLAQVDHAHHWGLDGGVTHQFGPVASATASYSFNVSAVGNGLGSTTTHELAAGVQVRVPDDWARDGWRSALRNLAAVAQLRMINGLPYSPEINVGSGDVSPGPISPGAVLAGGFNSEHLPWTKVLDLRVTKGVRMNGMDWTVFADFRNLLNFKNLYTLYTETNSTTNAVFEQRATSAEFVTLANEANANGALSGTSITLNNCANWQGSAGPVDCVMLRRAEARFGNGDGTYTLAEQENTLHNYFEMVFGSYQFYGPQRTVRVGLSLAL